MTLFRSIGKRRPARDEPPPRPPQCRPPAEQKAEWWGGRGAREDDWDPCTGAGPLKTSTDEKGDDR